ncbi:MAG: hypothetical protein AB8I08_25180 [Sandaracinaceae bacterium]
MDRTTVQEILDGAAGMKPGDDGYTVEDEHLASIYLANRGSATVLSELVRIKLADTWIEAEAKDRTLHYATYEPVTAISIRRPRDPDKQRTGF